MVKRIERHLTSPILYASGSTFKSMLPGNSLCGSKQTNKPNQTKAELNTAPQKQNWAPGIGSTCRGWIDAYIHLVLLRPLLAAARRARASDGG